MFAPPPPPLNRVHTGFMCVSSLGFQAAATEELRDAGQRKIAGFAERAAAAERQARDAVARLRLLASAQETLQVRKRVDISFP